MSKSKIRQLKTSMERVASLEARMPDNETPFANDLHEYVVKAMYSCEKKVNRNTYMNKYTPVKRRRIVDTAIDKFLDDNYYKYSPEDIKRLLRQMLKYYMYS